MKSLFGFIILCLFATPSYAEYWGCVVTVNDATIGSSNQLFESDDIAVNVEYGDNLKELKIDEKTFLEFDLSVYEDEITMDMALYSEQENPWEVVYSMEMEATNAKYVKFDMEKVTIPDGRTLEFLMECEK